MMQEFSRGRRFAVAALALVCSALLFRAQIAEALVIRGDDYMYRGDPVHALERYGRALTIAPSSGVAADRYAFVSLQRRTHASIAAAIAVANRYLGDHPNDAALLTDRALCYLQLHRYMEAERDFERAARSSRAPSDYVFAGWAAQHAGHTRTAVALWREALRIRPGYRPADVALSVLHR